MANTIATALARSLLRGVVDGLGDISGAERDLVALHAVHSLYAAASALARAPFDREVRDNLLLAYRCLGNAECPAVRLRALAWGDGAIS